jgi:hypothetical protein
VREFAFVLLAWAAVQSLKKVLTAAPAALGDLLLDDLLRDSSLAADLSFSSVWDSPTARECFLNQSFTGFAELLDDPRLRRAIEWHEYGGIKYYNKERFESVVSFLGFLTLVEDSVRHEIPQKEQQEVIGGVQTFLIRLLELSAESEYKFDELMKLLSGAHAMEPKPGNGAFNG